MKIVVAADSFKECLAATAVCEAIAAGLRDADEAAEVLCVPMADGGEGSLDVLLAAGGGERHTVTVTGPMGQPLQATFGWQLQRETAIIEAAAANGLGLVPPAERDPTVATTRGVGELILAALKLEPRKLLITVGGSGTVDGGAGAARALGFGAIDRIHQDLAEGGAALQDLHRFSIPARRPWERVTIEVACDVSNTLLGERGAARFFGPQKGATPEQVEQLEAGLTRFAKVLREHHGIDIAALTGGGAAGGLAAGLAALCGARLRPGVDLVAEHVSLDAALKGADLVITGEGSTDIQTPYGKVCAGVARHARERDIPCVILSGRVDIDPQLLRRMGVLSAIAASPPDMPAAEAIAQAPELLRSAAAILLMRFQAGGLGLPEA